MLKNIGKFQKSEDTKCYREYRDIDLFNISGECIKWYNCFEKLAWLQLLNQYFSTRDDFATPHLVLFGNVRGYFWLSQPGCRCYQHAIGAGQGVLLSILHCTGQPAQQRTMVQYVGSAETEKTWFRQLPRMGWLVKSQS